MSDIEKAAFLITQAVCCAIEGMGMVSENMRLQHFGDYPIYGKEDFDKLLDKYPITHNAVITYLGG